MTKNFRFFLIGLGVLVGGFGLLLVIGVIAKAQSDKSDLAELKKLQLHIQVLKNQNTRIEAERAGEQAVREYDMKNASLEELHRMSRANIREIERLNAIIRVEKQRQ